tara:strand:+ start:32 stop:811 length:780 start_codon:yes stop_codon:yes gene_type:complete
MDITFDTIINYLSTKKDYFINKINIVRPIDNFNFDLPVFRIGILNNIKQKNISLIQAILYLINPEYIYQTKEDKVTMMDKFINDIRNYWKNNYKSDNDFSILDGENIINDLPYQLNTDEKFKKCIYILSFCLKLNFLILDFNTEKSSIISYYMNESNLNFYRPFIILAKKDNNIEPIFSNNKKLFEYDDIINYLTEYNSIKIEDIFQTKSVFITSNNIGFSIEQLKKKKKKELMEMCDNQGIKYLKKDIKLVLIKKLLN